MTSALVVLAAALLRVAAWAPPAARRAPRRVALRAAATEKTDEFTVIGNDGKRVSLSKGEKERKFSFVWNVCGDLLLTVKVRNGQQGCGRAPLAVDATRLRSRLRPRRRNKGPASPADADDDGATEWPLLDAGEP